MPPTQRQRRPDATRPNPSDRRLRHDSRRPNPGEDRRSAPRPNGDFLRDDASPARLRRRHASERERGEVPVYCDCCPTRPRKMAVIWNGEIQIIARRSGKKHRARLRLPTAL